jgi:hypothetical protein
VSQRQQLQNAALHGLLLAAQRNSAVALYGISVLARCLVGVRTSCRSQKALRARAMHQSRSRGERRRSVSRAPMMASNSPGAATPWHAQNKA